MRIQTESILESATVIRASLISAMEIFHLQIHFPFSVFSQKSGSAMQMLSIALLVP